MGQDITECDYSSDALSRFNTRLDQNLAALSQLLSRESFGQTQPDSLVFGAELELYIVDSAGKPLSINNALFDEVNDPQLTLELNRYNIEYNLTPYAITDQPFLATENEIVRQLNTLNAYAAKHAGRVLPIGILPTLERCHFGPAMVTNRKRYHTLVEQLLARRGRDFEININGEHPLTTTMSDVTLEGANTSLQIHYRVNPEEYVDTFNAVQLVTPLMLAISANSPGLFGHRLWQETRIPLFKQSIDTRHKDRYSWCQPARVNFGHGWLRQSPLDLIQETVRCFPPLLPVFGTEDPLHALSAGRTPKLEELRMHLSTVWWWNRSVYDDTDNGHLRIEMRALPAGPTAVDMLANAAFYIGLAEYFKHHMPIMTAALPFHLAEYNFYRCAQHGLQAEIIWPDKNQSECKQYPVTDILAQCLPLARQGLASLNVNPTEINRYLPVIEHRLNRRQNGAQWQIKTENKYLANHSRPKSLSLMLEDYITNCNTNIPVANWQ